MNEKGPRKTVENISVDNPTQPLKRSSIVRVFSGLLHMLKAINHSTKSLFLLTPKNTSASMKPSSPESRALYSLTKEYKKSTKLDWVNTLNALQQEVRKLELGIDCLDSKSMTFDVLGASTYLLQIDILLAKNRQNLKAFERLEKNFDHVQKDLEVEFIKANNAFIDCYKTHLELLFLIRDSDLDCLKGGDIIRNVQVLEVQTRSQAESVQVLNDFVLKKAPLSHLFESELFRALHQVDYSKRDLSFNPYAGLTDIAKGSPTAQSMRESVDPIQHSEYRLIAYNLITYYESLKQYYIFLPGKQMQDLTDMLKSNIQSFIEESKKDEPGVNNLYKALYGVFAGLEAVRFIPNTRHYQSRNLHDKARLMRKQLRTFLAQTELGRKFLDEHLLITVRDKLFLKSKF